MKALKYIYCLLIMLLCMSCNKAWQSQYESDVFYVNGIKGIIVKPTIEANGKWIVRPAFIGAYPYVDDSLLNRGYTVGFYDVTHEYGNDIAQSNFKEFLNYCKSTYSLSGKVILEGFSRGGFFALCYAENHPEDVDKVYVDNPVCNLKSWPLKQDSALYNDASEKWQKCGFDIDSIYDYPIKHFNNIISNNIPVVLVYGCLDTIVPFDENFGMIKTNGYDKLLVISKPYEGHHPHSIERCEPILEFLEKECGDIQ